MPRPFITVKEMWEHFAEILPKEASEVQRAEMKLAFFAGCQSFLAGQMALANAPDDMAISVLESWRVELAYFGENNSLERFT